MTPHSLLPTETFTLLAAPLGQLSGDGQLRELIQERRDRKDAEPDLWYLTPALLKDLGLSEQCSPSTDPVRGDEPIEAVLATDPAVITWLELRFGGRASTVALSAAVLQDRAAAVPPLAALAALAT